MAITRAQQVKQMLREGGRIGLKPGGPPGGGATSMGSGRDYSAPDKSKGPAGGQTMTGGGGYSDKERQQRRDLKEAVNKVEKEKLEERLENFRKLNSRTRQFQNFAKKYLPSTKFLSQFGPLNNRDFFTDKVLGSKNFSDMTREDFAMLSEEDKEKAFDDYMSGRMSGKTDAYGNTLSQGDGDGMSDYERRLLELEQATRAQAAVTHVFLR